MCSPRVDMVDTCITHRGAVTWPPRHIHARMGVSGPAGTATHIAGLDGRRGDQALAGICHYIGSVFHGDGQVVATAQKGGQNLAIPEVPNGLQQQDQGAGKSVPGLCVWSTALCRARGLPRGHHHIGLQVVGC